MPTQAGWDFVGWRLDVVVWLRKRPDLPAGVNQLLNFDQLRLCDAERGYVKGGGGGVCLESMSQMDSARRLTNQDPQRVGWT